MDFFCTRKLILSPPAIEEKSGSEHGVERDGEPEAAAPAGDLAAGDEAFGVFGCVEHIKSKENQRKGPPLPASLEFSDSS
jgi:hypothetical protein